MRKRKTPPWWIKWASSAGGGLLSAFAATVVPSYLQYILATAGAFLVLAATVGTIAHVVRTHEVLWHKVVVVGGAAIIGGGIILSVGWYLWTHHPTATDIPLDGTIGFACGPTSLPESSPSSATIAFLEAFPPKPSNTFQLGFGSSPNQPGRKWSRDGKPLEAWHCTITNYGPAAIYFLQFTFHEEYRAARADGSCITGVPNQTYDRPTVVHQLGIGRQEAFHFYVWNAGTMCTSIAMPTKAKVWNMHEHRDVSFDLVPPNVSNVILGPTH